MSLANIKRLYDSGWTRRQIAEEICYQDHDIDFETAMLIVETAILKMQKMR